MHTLRIPVFGITIYGSGTVCKHIVKLERIFTGYNLPIRHHHIRTRGIGLLHNQNEKNSFLVLTHRHHPMVGSDRYHRGLCCHGTDIPKGDRDE